jgi:hypothetical protein
MIGIGGIYMKKQAVLSGFMIFFIFLHVLGKPIAERFYPSLEGAWFMWIPIGLGLVMLILLILERIRASKAPKEDQISLLRERIEANEKFQRNGFWHYFFTYGLFAAILAALIQILFSYAEKGILHFGWGNVVFCVLFWVLFPTFVWFAMQKMIKADKQKIKVLESGSE